MNNCCAFCYICLQMSEIFHIFANIMTDEQIAAKKEHAGEKRVSMKRRDDHHDYTERRMYMITLEVEGRRPVFGRLVGKGKPYRASGWAFTSTTRRLR